MRRAQLSISTLPAWCKFNNISFHDVVIRDLGASGNGIVTDRALSAEDGIYDIPALMMVPNDLVLCREAIDEHIKVDSHFRELVAAAGGKSLKGDMALFLLMQTTIGSTDRKHNLGVSSPWTEYVKMLPNHVPLPTMWTEEECIMLKGTSLEVALLAKMAALNEEFETLRAATSTISWCQTHWWDNQELQLSDWVLVDAWFRSRTLEHPSLDEAMIPALDMVNHSLNANAFYETGTDGCVHLLLRPGTQIDSNTEVTISYGDMKSKAEMLFSYGFVDETTGVKSKNMTLPLQPDYTTDPLGKAKEAIFSNSNLHRTVELMIDDGTVKWKSPFLYLIVVNEEDGLDFRVLQNNDGSRGSLKVFWQENDITETVASFDSHITEDQSNDLREVFMLRAVVTLEEQLQNQLQRLNMADEEISALAEQIDLDVEKQKAAILLREDERNALEDAIRVINLQKLDLFQSDKVRQFLESRTGHHEDDSHIEDFS